jgi:hypothetical protein
MSRIVIVMLIYLRHKPIDLIDESLLVDILFTVRIPASFTVIRCVLCMTRIET